MLDGYLIWRALKKIPSCFKDSPPPSNIKMGVNKSGSMDRQLMKDYGTKIIKPYLDNLAALGVPFNNNDPNNALYLIMDSYGSHCTVDVVQFFKLMGVEILLIPGGFTSILQMCDVSVNVVFKNAYLKQHTKWMAEPELYGLVGISDRVVATDGANRRKPPYEVLVQWCSYALEAVKKETIIRSFPACGLYINHNEFNGLAFVDGLHNGLKRALLINKGPMVYEQFHFVRDLIVNEYKDSSEYLIKCQEYISKYRRGLKNKGLEQLEIQSMKSAKKDSEIIFSDEEELEHIAAEAMEEGETGSDSEGSDSYGSDEE